MARYRKIDPRIWNDEKVAGLSKHGQLAFLYVLTHPNMTALGAMRATVPGLAAELNVPVKAFQEAFQVGLLEADEQAAYLGAPNFIRYNPPESANVVKAWGKSWDLIPECPAKVCLWERVKAFLEAFPEDFRKAFLHVFPQDFPLSGAGAGAGAGAERGREGERVPVKRAPAPRGCIYPETFVPDERAERLVQSYGLNLHKLLAAFKDHHQAKGTIFKDWQAAFRNWIRNEVKFNQRGSYAL